MKTFQSAHAAGMHLQRGGSGHPLVLLHGVTLDHRMWAEQFSVLADHFDVIAYDLKGFGQSPARGGGDHSPDADLAELLDALDLSSAHVMGLSMGGGVAAGFAVRYPQLVDRLILVDAALGGFSYTSPFIDVLRGIREASLNAEPEKARKLWFDCGLFVPAREHADIEARLVEMVDDFTHWEILGEPFIPDVKAQLDSISAPALVVMGERDIKDFQDIARLLVATIPDARGCTLPGVGHMSNMEDPAAFNAAVLDFLLD